jgi:hypothetical protein
MSELPDFAVRPAIPLWAWHFSVAETAGGSSRKAQPGSREKA